jgi:hypothetical protein
MKGLTKEYGIDYKQTLAHVSRLTLVKFFLIIVVVCVCHLQLFQIDTKKMSFSMVISLRKSIHSLHLDMGIFWHNFCRLRCALYSPKQAPQVWFAKFSPVVSQQGFVPSSFDFALFLRKTNVDTILVLSYFMLMIRLLLVMVLLVYDLSKIFLVRILR